MSRNTYSNPRLFLGSREIINFNSISYKNGGRNTVSTLSVKIDDPELDDAALLGKEVVFFLNYGSDDTVPFFRGRIRQNTPSNKNTSFVAHDVRTFLTGNDSIPLSLTDDDNYDGYTLGQFLYAYITDNININETIIGLDMLNETDPVSTLSGTRGNNLNPIKIIQSNLPKNDNSLTDIRLNRLKIIDDGQKSNICFVKEQGIDDAAIRFSYSDGIKNVSVKKRPSPNVLSAKVGENNVLYKHNNLATGISGGKITGKFDYPDEAIQSAYIQATQAELDSEISLTTTKGHYLGIGNIVSVSVSDYPEITGKHRIVSKQITCSKGGVTCTLQLAKERPLLSEYLNQ